MSESLSISQIIIIQYLIYLQSHVSTMNLIHLLILFLSLIFAYTQPACLLEEPLTDKCISSLKIDAIDKQTAPYLCVIALERSLLSKAEELCRKATLVNLQSGYLYFKVLLLMNKFEEAFKHEYYLFFTSPFTHNNEVLQILNQTKSTLSKLQMKSTNYKKLSLFSKAILHFYNNEVDHSLVFLKQRLQAHRNNTQLLYEHFLMARIFQVQFQYYDGMNYITQVLKKNTKTHPYLYHLKGNFLMHHVQFQKAIAEFEKANQYFHNLYKSNGFSFSNYNIGLCYQKLDNVKQAIRYYQKSIINLNSAEALNALGHAHYSLYGKQNDEKHLLLAQIYYKKSLEIDQYTVAIFNLGMLELARKNIPLAIQKFQKCLSMENTFRSCKYGLIKCYYQLNQKDKANLVISTLQINEEVLTQLLAILYELQDHQKALQLAGSREDYKSSELMEWKGFNQYELGLFEKAEKSFARAVFLGAKKGYVYYSLGLAQLQLKKYGECLRSLDSAYRMEARQETKIKRDECKKLSENSEL